MRPKRKTNQERARRYTAAQCDTISITPNWGNAGHIARSRAPCIDHLLVGARRTNATHAQRSLN
eukprot:1922929-Lingulodinium_polyedra.AAC.1